MPFMEIQYSVLKRISTETYELVRNFCNNHDKSVTFYMNDTFHKSKLKKYIKEHLYNAIYLHLIGYISKDKY